MLSPKFLLVFLAVIAYAQGNSCRGDNIDLCSLIKAINSLGVKIEIVALIIEIQNIIGSVISTIACSIGLSSICLPFCTVIQSLLNLGIEVDIIELIVVEIGAEAPDCGLGTGIF